MMRMPCKLLLWISLVLAACNWLAGCVGSGAFSRYEDIKPTFINKSMSLQEAQDLIVIGSSIKADLLAALGPATVVKFDSGYEVWVYRGKPAKAPATGAEFVVLFSPAGIVMKTRIRPAYDGRAQ